MREREVELKYLLERAELPPLPNNWSLIGAPARIVLHDEYLDANGGLASLGLALRRRSTERGILFTLKGARSGGAMIGALHDRMEIEGTEIGVPTSNASIAAAIAQATTVAATQPVNLSALSPRLRIVQQRMEQRLARNGVACATISIDSIEAERDGRRATWFELEIEFDGSGKVVLSNAQELDAALRATSRLEPSLLAKSERAEALLSR